MPVDLKGLLPHYYVGCAEMDAFQDAFEPEVQLLWESYESLLRQLIVETADADYGLLLWEKMLGIPTDASKAVSYTHLNTPDGVRMAHNRFLKRCEQNKNVRSVR